MVSTDLKCPCGGTFKPLGFGSDIIECSRCKRRGNLRTGEFDPPKIKFVGIILSRTSWIENKITIMKKDPQGWLGTYLQKGSPSN